MWTGYSSSNQLFHVIMFRVQHSWNLSIILRSPVCCIQLFSHCLILIAKRAALLSSYALPDVLISLHCHDGSSSPSSWTMVFIKLGLSSQFGPECYFKMISIAVQGET